MRIAVCDFRTRLGLISRDGGDFSSAFSIMAEGQNAVSGFRTWLEIMWCKSFLEPQDVAGRQLALADGIYARHPSQQLFRLQPVETLSKGFKRRVGLAQSLLHDPPVLVLDEPTNHLSVKETNKVIGFVRSLKLQNITGIFISHNMHHVFECCDRIVAMAHANDVPAEHIYLFDASRQSKRISANVSGIGPTIRISLNDNLLNRSSEAEIAAVMGHELGHYVLGHAWRNITALSLLVGLLLFLASRAAPALIARYGARWGVRDLADPASLPNGPGETVLTGTEAEQVTAAALAAEPGATIIRVETDSSGHTYEAHVVTADGTQKTLYFNASFEADGSDEGFGPAPQGDHGAPPAGAPGDAPAATATTG